MATKKAASNAKKSVNKPITKKQATTKVTTIKAVESHPVHHSVTASAKAPRNQNAFRTPLIAAVIAEFIGTFIFAAVIIAGQGQPILALFALVGVVLATGKISNGYANPALVIGSWVTKRISGIRAIAYIIAQVLGAMMALVVLNAFVNAIAPAASSATGMTASAAPKLFAAAVLPAGHEWFIVLSEFVGTFIFGFAVAGALREKIDRTAAAFTVGLGVFLGLMVSGSAAAYLGANAILNPAVAISLKALSFSLWPIMVYIVGSIVGAVVGFMLYDYLRKASAEEVVA